MEIIPFILVLKGVNSFGNVLRWLGIRNATTGVFALGISLLFAALIIIINFLLGDSRTLNTFLWLLWGSSVIFLIIILLYRSLNILERYMDSPLLANVLYDADVNALIEAWVKSAFSPKKQIIFVFVYCSFMIPPTIVLFLNLLSDQLGVSGLIAIVVGAVVVANGAYTILLMPTYLNSFKDFRLKLYSLSPRDSKFINATLNVTHRFVLLFSFILAFISLPVIAYSGPNRLAISVFYYAIEVILLLWLFLFPHYTLSQIIGSEKQLILEDLQQKIEDKFQDKAQGDTGFNEKVAKELEILFAIYDRVRNSPGNTLNLDSLFNYFGSLILPTASFILAVATAGS